MIISRRLISTFCGRSPASLKLVAALGRGFVLQQKKTHVPELISKIGNCTQPQATQVSQTNMSDGKNQYNVVFVLGGPGAGKGTQCEKIETEFGFRHLSAGDLLRQERNAPGSQYGEIIEGHIKNGSIVPVKITCSLLRREMENSPKNNFLIDGFPRNKDNLDGWNEEMDGVAQVKSVLFFNCPDQVCIDRCLSRGQTSGRSDDNVESLKKRIETYRNSTMPIIEHYRTKDLVAEIDANRTQEEVFKDVDALFKTLGC